jgi:hypothetical protein
MAGRQGFEPRADELWHLTDGAGLLAISARNSGFWLSCRFCSCDRVTTGFDQSRGDILETDIAR